MFIDLIDLIREDGYSRGTFQVDFKKRTPTGAPPLVIGLARFQSYRGRTEAALIQELEDYVEEAGLTTLRFQVLPEQSSVILW